MFRCEELEIIVPVADAELKLDISGWRNPHLALSPSWCALCRCSGEMIDQILLDCN